MIIDDIFIQAKLDSNSVKLDTDVSESRLLYGIKIIKEIKTQAISIYDTAVGGDRYKELTESQYVEFQKGWRVGVYKVRLDVYRDKLKKIERKIVDELNGKNNPTQLQLLKDNKNRTIKNYFKLTQKLNQHE
jgi:hypothetical protein